MLKTRLIPVLLLKNGILVRSRNFSLHQSTGNHLYQVQRFSEWKADEIIYLDITRDDKYNLYSGQSVIGSTSSNINSKQNNQNNIIDIIKSVSKVCRVPLTIGGKIKNLKDISLRFKAGADKVAINTAALNNPLFIKEASEEFGSQCIVVSIDVKKDLNSKSNSWNIYKNFGKEIVDIDLKEWIHKIQYLGAGEILIQSIDRDGQGKGYDLELLKTISKISKIPVIALSGVGEYQDFVDGYNVNQDLALAAANIFHFTELSVLNAKKYMIKNKINTRL